MNVFRRGSEIFLSFIARNFNISLRKKIGSFGMKHITISFIKILCASLGMNVIAKVSYDALLNSIDVNLSLIIVIGTGTLSYFIIIVFV
mgnify:CR=1 FL=1